MSCSVVDRVRMVPAAEDDPLHPGTFYLACLDLQRKTNANSYWIVLRAPKEWLPQDFIADRPTTMRSWPFWVLGRDERIWLPRNSLFILDRSQRDIFPQRTTKLEFTNSIILIASFQNTEAALLHFERRIVQATRDHITRREKERADIQDCDDLEILSERHVQSDADAHPLNVLTPRTEPKTEFLRAKILVSNDNIYGIDPNNLNYFRSQHQPHPQDVFSNAYTTSFLNGRPSPIMKYEKDDHPTAYMATVPVQNRVRIYVGPEATKLSADSAAIETHSTIISGMMAYSDNEGKFIMHPRLREVNVKDFQSVLEFIHTGQYKPITIKSPKGKPSPLALEGCTTVEDYSAALVQAARLLMLAKAFQVKGLIGQIYHKITRAQYKAFSNLSVLEFATIVLPRQGCNMTEVLDIWVMHQMAENLVQIMESEEERKKYLALVDVTGHLKLHALVLEKAASNYRAIGGVPVVIDDD